MHACVCIYMYIIHSYLCKHRLLFRMWFISWQYYSQSLTFVWNVWNVFSIDRVHHDEASETTAQSALDDDYDTGQTFTCSVLFDHLLDKA